MSFDINYTNTATNPVTPARSTITPAPINFGADFRILKEAPGEVILTNINASVQNPETIRVAYSEVADVFKGTGVEPNTDAVALNNGIKRGCSLLIQNAGVGVDGNGARFPYSAHLVLKVPFGPEPDYNFLSVAIGRLLGTLYDTGEGTPQTRMESLLRGALAPKEL